MNRETPIIADDDSARMPHNIEAEAAFLGALMIDNRIAEDITLKLEPRHFFEPLHGRLFAKIRDLLNDNKLVSPVTLKTYFAEDPAIKELGGVGYLARLTEESGAVLGARAFAEQIYELALLRELVSVGRGLVERAMDTSESVDPRGQIEAAESALYNVAEGEGETGSVKSFEVATRAAIANIEKALNAEGKLSGVTTGLTDLNNKTAGLHHSDLVILAGRPGMGKTSLATNIAFNAAMRMKVDLASGIEREKSFGAGVAFFSLEMSADQLATRILSEQARISSEKLRTGEINEVEFRELSRASQDLYDLPLYIDDTAGLTIAALRTRARRLKRRHNIGLIVVDYLQLLQGTGRNDNRVNEISEISRGLKTLAKELNVPVLALSQLSRAVESREDKRPQLSDLRESGSIEQDADIVLFIYREEYYHLAVQPDVPDENSSAEQQDKYREWEIRHQELQGKASVIVAKQRHGSTGNVMLRFESEFTRFSDLAHKDYSYSG